MKKLFLFFSLLLPLGILVYQIVFLQNLNDPIKYIYNFTGVTSTILLFVTITFTLIKKWINLVKYRKIFGLMGFFYAFLHLLNFYIFDAEFDLAFMVKQSLEKPFIYLGMTAFFILLFMAFTSTKELFRKYNRYHKLIYLALVLITIHFIMAQKSLSLEQLFYILIILIIGYFKLLQQIIYKNNI